MKDTDLIELQPEPYEERLEALLAFTEADFKTGCNMPADYWARFNRKGYKYKPLLNAIPDIADYVAPFPPDHLRRRVSGVKTQHAFGAQGADIWLALSAATDQPLSQYRHILDFGCGCGRLGRMFKGIDHPVDGCDIDAEVLDWTVNHLPYYRTTLTLPNHPLPYANNYFDLIISISIFSHLSETSQLFLLQELHRIASKTGRLMLTIHGERALKRAEADEQTWHLLAVDAELFADAKKQFLLGRYAFIAQQNHLTRNDYDYGITFIPASYVEKKWGQWFHIEKHVSGAIHDFQDIVVLTPKS